MTVGRRRLTTGRRSAGSALVALIQFLPSGNASLNLRKRCNLPSSSSRSSRPAVLSRGACSAATQLSNDQTGHDPASRRRSNNSSSGQSNRGGLGGGGGFGAAICGLSGGAMMMSITMVTTYLLRRVIP